VSSWSARFSHFEVDHFFETYFVFGDLFFFCSLKIFFAKIGIDITFAWTAKIGPVNSFLTINFPRFSPCMGCQVACELMDSRWYITHSLRRPSAAKAFEYGQMAASSVLPSGSENRFQPPELSSDSNKPGASCFMFMEVIFDLGGSSKAPAAARPVDEIRGPGDDGTGGDWRDSARPASRALTGARS